jgi:hypothetical protein
MAELVSIFDGELSTLQWASPDPFPGTDFTTKPRKLVLQLTGLAAKNLPNVISKLEERIDRHRGKITFGHFPPPTRCQHSLLLQQKMSLMVSKRKRVYTTLVIASGLHILSRCAGASLTVLHGLSL